jgi:hypothetical protein
MPASALRITRFVSWSRRQRALHLPLSPGRTVGFSWDRSRKELCLIVGSKTIERSAFGTPKTFIGGFHLMLSKRRPFLISASPNFLSHRLT